MMKRTQLALAQLAIHIPAESRSARGSASAPTTPLVLRRPSIQQLLESTTPTLSPALDEACLPSSIDDICSAKSVAIYVSDRTWSSSMRPAETSGRAPLQRKRSTDFSDLQILMELNSTQRASDIVLAVIREVFDDKLIESWGGDEGILKRFGLVEAEYIYDEDEDMSLFTLDENSEWSPNMTPLSARIDPSLRERKSLSRSISAEAIQRRIHRLLSPAEMPLFVYHNWKFYRRVSRVRRRGSEGSGGRRFHFYIKELNDEDRMTLELASGQKLFPEMIVQRTVLSVMETHRNHQLMNLPHDRLRKRLALVDREEQRAMEEAKQRYQRQQEWIMNALENMNK